MQLNPRILVAIIVPDSEPERATPLQGFAPSLCSNVWMIGHALALPSSIFDPTPEGRLSLIMRRMSGADPVNWVGQTPRAIRAVPIPASLPFLIVMLGSDQDPRDYQEWANNSPVAPTMVADRGGDLTFSELSLNILQQRFLDLCTRIPASIDGNSLAMAVDAIRSWESPKQRSLGYSVRGHNSVAPNVAVLESAGFGKVVAGPMKDILSGFGPFVEQIVKTSHSILELRTAVGNPFMHRVFPPTIAINLFAPAIYPHFFKLKAPSHIDPKERKAFLLARQALERQSGYSHIARTPAQIRAMIEISDDNKGAKPRPNPLMMIRAEELRLATAAISTLAVSEASAVLRLPNGINRSSGVVRNFAAQYRGNSPQSRKRLNGFRSVQQQLAGAFPNEFLEFVRTANTGVRIVADAHLEWLDVDGLPLCIRRNITRLPVTPGNLFIQNVTNPDRLVLSPNDLQKILVIDALERKDPVRKAFEIAFAAFEPHLQNLKIQFAEVSAENDLVKVLNEFEGNIVIFDGHGIHETNEPAKLYLKEKPIDVWSLKGKLERIPPIMVLSACDTHAADRNHATTGNGFLALGTMTVLASVFPLDAREAAAFTARLLFRIASYVPTAPAVLGRAVSWMEIISGMLRMQLLTNYLRQLLQNKLIDEETYIRVHTFGNELINGGEEQDPFGATIKSLEATGIPTQKLKAQLELATANSPAISYLQLGRPDAILIDLEERLEFVRQLFQRSGEPEDTTLEQRQNG